jgi:hypothetical protein
LFVIVVWKSGKMEVVKGKEGKTEKFSIGRRRWGHKLLIDWKGQIRSVASRTSTLGEKNWSGI